MPAETGSDPETTLNETGLMYTLHFVSGSSQEAKASAKNDGNLLPSCTNQPSGRHCHAVLGALSLQLHPYRKISGRRNCAGPLLPANSRKSHSLSLGVDTTCNGGQICVPDRTGFAVLWF